ncbi:MAG: hypothetical protein H6945_16485 [Zoogloeaceae bacterium]|nr:hypothetical protein [Rhodocyclaceae bacterium]MCP5237336.1 hypothetical protein [Zoogloeaceae bacterium]
MGRISTAIISGAIFAGALVSAPTSAAGRGGGPPVSAMAIECNWGRLTMETIQGGFEQGPHAADPSGDGFGPGTLDEPRAGLANVVERGRLDLLCQLIEDLMSEP